METRLFLVVLLVTFANAEFGPADAELEISADLVRGFNLTCYAREFYGLVPISIVLSSAVNKSNVASASDNKIINTFQGASMNYRISRYDSSVFLALTWDDLESFPDGDYTCTLYVLGPDNIPRAISKTTTIKVSDLDPVVKARPENIKDGLDKSFLVQCASVSLALHGLSKPCKLQIFHTNVAGTQELIASADYGDSNSTKTDVDVHDDWEVSSVYTEDQIVLLEISKKGYPTTSQAGTYTCIISANQTDELVKTTQVTASAATREEIYERTVDDNSKDFYFRGCTFENGICGSTILNPEDEPNWNRIQSRFAESVDHTLGDGLGYLARVKLPAGSSLVATLRTKEQPATRKQTCLSFWFVLVGRNTQLSIFTKPSSSEYASLQNSYYGQNYGYISWTRSQMTLYSTSEPYTVEFRFSNNYTSYYYYGYYSYSSYYNAQDGYALIDDIVITDICNSNY